VTHFFILLEGAGNRACTNIITDSRRLGAKARCMPQYCVMWSQFVLSSGLSLALKIRLLIFKASYF